MSRLPTPQSILRKAKNWSDFTRLISSVHDKKRKGDVFELHIKFHLELSPVYASKLAKVWLLHEAPKKIHDRLNLPDADEGIDLIAQTDTGEYWVIQSKYRSDENASLTRTELSTFTDLAFGICRHIRLGLVCTPTNRISYMRIDLVLFRVTRGDHSTKTSSEMVGLGYVGKAIASSH